MATGNALTDEELAAIGVKRIRDEFGMRYEVPCAICGRPAVTRQFSINRAYKCTLCKHDVQRAQQAARDAERRRVDEIMASAMGVDYEHYRRFEKGAAKFGDSYIDDIEKARGAIEKFDSVPEVVACIELLHIGTSVIVHQPVGDYTVDFCLPDEKVVVEIDGSIYHTDTAKQDMRDYAITYMLDGDWAIRHIPSDAVMKNHEKFGRGMRRLLADRRS